MILTITEKNQIKQNLNSLVPSPTEACVTVFPINGDNYCNTCWAAIVHVALFIYLCFATVVYFLFLLLFSQPNLGGLSADHHQTLPPLVTTEIYNKKAELSQRWPCDAPYVWVPWKFLGLPAVAVLGWDQGCTGHPKSCPGPPKFSG